MELSIKIENLKEVQSALKKSPQIVSKHINKAINRSIIDIRDASVRESPVDTGRLRGSHEMKFGSLRGEVYPSVNYAIFVHQGHRQEVGRFVPAIGKRLVSPFVKGNPFLKRAVGQVENKINKNFQEGLSESLEEIARSV